MSSSHQIPSPSQAPTNNAAVSVSKRESLLCKARLAEQVENYQDVADSMAQLVVEAAGDLTLEERNLFSVGFKNLVSNQRACWRRLGELHNGHVSLAATDPKHFKMSEAAEKYKLNLESRIAKICWHVIRLLKEHILPLVHPTLARLVPDLIENAKSFRARGFDNVDLCLKSQLDELLSRSDVFGDLDARSGENVVFYYKMLGDYYRFLAELSLEKDDERREPAAHHTLCLYSVAAQIGKLQLPPTHPVRLGLALNFSVFYFEILQKPEHAYRIAESSYDGAHGEMGNADKATFKDSEFIMQLIKDNLKNWTSLDE
jgi:14-3-3 protein epsilon